MTSAWWETVPRRLNGPSPVVAWLWRDGGQWRERVPVVGAVLPAVGVAAGLVAVLVQGHAPHAWAPLSAIGAAVALGVAGGLSAHTGLLAWLVLTLTALARDSTPRSLLVGAAMTFLLAVLIPTAIRNVAPALPGPSWTRLIYSPMLTVWLLYAWVQAVPLARDIAVYGDAPGAVSPGPASWLALYIAVATVATLRSALDLRFPSTGVVSAATSEGRVGVALRTLAGAALLVLPWTPLLRHAPVLLGACVVLAVVLRLMRVGVIPGLLPRRARTYVAAQPGLTWVLLALTGFLLCNQLSAISKSSGVIVGASIALGLLLATLVEVTPAATAPLQPEPLR